jgi:hypothetical protein
MASRNCERTASPCATCPWLRENHGKVNPADPSWYTLANAKRLWNGIRQGEAMICHATDPESADYGGKGAKPGHERMCVGMLVLVARTFKMLGTTKPAEYKKGAGGKMRMTPRGILAWIERFTFRGSAIGTPKDVMPVSYDGAAAARCGVPWPDDVLNANDS